MEADERRRWTLLSSHGHVLVEIARNPRARVRDISAIIGITERATQAIIADLERAGYVERIRIGRRTHYVLHPDNAFRHSAQDGLQVGPFLELLAGTGAVGAVGAAGETGEASAEKPVLTGATEIALAAAAAALSSEPVLSAEPALNVEPVLSADPALNLEPVLSLEPVMKREPALEPALGPESAVNSESARDLEEGLGLGPDLVEAMPLSPAPPPLLPPVAEGVGGPAVAGTNVPEPGIA